MHLSVLLPILPVVLGAPTVNKRSEPAPLLVSRSEPSKLIPGKYIVKFRDESHHSILEEAVSLLPGQADHVYNGTFKGFASKLSASELKNLRDHEHVEYIEQDSIASIASYVTQKSPPWGLSRISHRNTGIDEYVYDDSAGRGVCAYVIDSGVDDSHPEFEGRATQVTSFIQGQTYDNNGHGTHVSGTIGSKSYGVSKKVNIYGIKVLDGEGNGPYSTIISGMEYVSRDASRRNCPNGIVVNMSIGGGYNQACNDAARGLVNQGYFVAVAAGNNNDDASKYSPSSESSVCTVGGSAKYDTRYTSSNYGRAVDIVGPAVDVYSTFPNGQTGFDTGTSMATPHITGLAAYLASLNNEKAGPGLCQRMQQTATKNKITNQSSNTVNLIAFNGNPSG